MGRCGPRVVLYYLGLPLMVRYPFGVCGGTQSTTSSMNKMKQKGIKGRTFFPSFEEPGEGKGSQEGPGMAQGSGDEGGRHLHVSGNWAEVPVRNLGVTLHAQSCSTEGSRLHTALHLLLKEQWACVPRRNRVYRAGIGHLGSDRVGLSTWASERKKQLSTHYFSNISYPPPSMQRQPCPGQQ